MAGSMMSVWLDPESDFLEILFDTITPGYFRETDDDRVMEKVDQAGKVLGISILGVSTLKSPLPIAIKHGASDVA